MKSFIGRRGKGVDYLIFPGGRKRGYIGGDQKIPDQPVKVLFLGEGVTAIRLGIKSWFHDVGFSTSDSMWGLLSPPFFFKQ